MSANASGSKNASCTNTKQSPDAEQTPTRWGAPKPSEVSRQRRAIRLVDDPLVVHVRHPIGRGAEPCTTCSLPLSYFPQKATRFAGCLGVFCACSSRWGEGVSASGRDGVEAPLAGDAFQLCAPAIFELESGGPTPG